MLDLPPEVLLVRERVFHLDQPLVYIPTQYDENPRVRNASRSRSQAGTRTTCQLPLEDKGSRYSS